MLPRLSKDTPKIHYFGGSDTHPATFSKSPCKIALNYNPLKADSLITQEAKRVIEERDFYFISVYYLES